MSSMEIREQWHKDVREGVNQALTRVDMKLIIVSPGVHGE